MESPEDHNLSVFFLQTIWYDDKFWKYVCFVLPYVITTQTNIVEEKYNDTNFEWKLTECFSDLKSSC